jgi:hypothetical protein
MCVYIYIYIYIYSHWTQFNSLRNYNRCILPDDGSMSRNMQQAIPPINSFHTGELEWDFDNCCVVKDNKGQYTTWHYMPEYSPLYRFCLLPASWWFAWLTLWPWIWRQYFLLTCQWASNRPHGVSCLDLLFSPEDGSSMFLWNVRGLLAI